MSSVHAREGTRAGYEVAWLIATVGIVGSQSLTAAPLLPDIAAGLDVTPATVGLALGAYGGATAITALAWAPFGDRWRRGDVLAVGLGILASALLLAASASDPLTLGLAQALSGVAAGILLPTCYAAAGDLAPSNARAQLMGRVLLGWSIAVVAGAPLGAVMGDLTGWRSVFLTIAAGAASLALIVRRLPDRRANAIGWHATPWRDALSIPTVGLLLGVCLLLMAAFYGAYGFLGVQVRAAHGSGAAAGLVVLAYGLGFTAAVRLGPLIDRRGPTVMMRLACVLLAAVYAALAPATESVPVLLVVMALLGLINHVALNTLVTLLTTAGAGQRGAVMAINSAVTYAGYMLGTAGMGMVFEQLGFTAVAAGSAVMMALAIVLVPRSNGAAAPFHATGRSC